jgi:hypothetical protein
MYPALSWIGMQALAKEGIDLADKEAARAVRGEVHRTW